MRGIAVTAITAALVGAATPAGATTPAHAATTPAAQAPPVTQRVDVDGDLRRDTVRFVRRAVTDDEYTFRITVITASGRRAIRDVLVANYGEGTLTPADAWGGTAHLDGVRGAEIQVDRGGGVGDFPWPHVYTWRNNRLVPEAAPGATPGDPAWTVADHFTLVAGYSFATVRGQRQVTATRLQGTFDRTRERLTYRGTRTTYRWHGDTWKRIGTTTTGTLAESRAQDFAGWNGVAWQP